MNRSRISLISMSLLITGATASGSFAAGYPADPSVIHAIPEPSTMILMMLGVFGLALSGVKELYMKVRRVIDIFISIIALSITAPIMLITVILIKLDSPGPVFYKQVRVGINRRKNSRPVLPGMPCKRKEDNFGKLFNIYKLRTMYTNAEAKTGPVWAKQNDTRITPLGRFLRKTRLDEIPQFFNVLRGDMSIVGPRPERPIFVKRLNDDIRHYNRRLRVQPGITGLAQVRYRYTDNVEDTKKKLKYDLLYVKKICLATDLSILISTFRTVFFARGSR